MPVRKRQFPINASNLPKPANVDAFATQYWREVLSDHLAQLMPITNDIGLLSWNIMTLGRGRNNAYRKVEDPETEYKPRLINVAQQLANTVHHNKRLAVIALQEVPHTKEYHQFFLSVVKAALPPYWVIDHRYYSKTQGSSFGTLFLYDSLRVLGEPIQKEISKLHYQRGRVMAVEFSFINEPHSITLVNGHFRYENELNERLTIEQTKQEINNIFESFPHQVIIAADLNQATESVAPFFAGRCFFTSGMTSLSYEPHCKKLIEQNIDAFLFKYEP